MLKEQIYSRNQDCAALWGATGRGRCCSSSAETKALQFLAPADDVGEKNPVEKQ